MEKNETTTKTVAKINDVNIMLIENGEKRVAIKPICDAIGVDLSGQLQRIKSDEILNSVMELSSTTGKDKKQYKMQTLPLKFVFGWLFTINPEKVKPESREALIQYKLECYDALWRHFTAYQEYVEFRQAKVEEHLAIEEARRREFNTAKEGLYEARENLNVWRKYNFEKYLAEQAQQRINFDESNESLAEG